MSLSEKCEQNYKDSNDTSHVHINLPMPTCLVRSVSKTNKFQMIMLTST